MFSVSSRSIPLSRADRDLPQLTSGPVCARAFACGAVIATVLACTSPVSAADLPLPLLASGYNNWTGFYFGGHLGNAWASSNFSTPGAMGTVNMQQTADT